MAETWLGGIAFANIGLPGEALRTSKWQRTHRPTLLEQFIKLLSPKSVCGALEFKVVGLCLNEVGNLSDLLSREDQMLFENLLEEAFDKAGATEHGPPQIYWSGETVAAWLHEQQVRQLPTLKKMPKVDAWRAVERFEVMHPAGSLLVYNNHQPSSSKRPFPPNMRINLCKAVLQDAVRQNEVHHGNHPAQRPPLGFRRAPLLVLNFSQVSSVGRPRGR